MAVVHVFPLVIFAAVARHNGHDVADCQLLMTALVHVPENHNKMIEL